LNHVGASFFTILELDIKMNVVANSGVLDTTNDSLNAHTTKIGIQVGALPASMSPQTPMTFGQGHLGTYQYGRGAERPESFIRRSLDRFGNDHLGRLNWRPWTPQHG
jgi:hypothetical protein